MAQQPIAAEMMQFINMMRAVPDQQVEVPEAELASSTPTKSISRDRSVEEAQDQQQAPEAEVASTPTKKFKTGEVACTPTRKFNKSLRGLVEDPQKFKKLKSGWFMNDHTRDFRGDWGG